MPSGLRRFVRAKPMSGLVRDETPNAVPRRRLMQRRRPALRMLGRRAATSARIRGVVVRSRLFKTERLSAASAGHDRVTCRLRFSSARRCAPRGNDMLDDFIAAHALAIEERTRQRLAGRVYPSLSPRELEYGVPLFLTQLAETLRLESTPAPFAAEAIGSAATRHGAELFDAGFTVSQVVHDYGDICQALTA